MTQKTRTMRMLYALALMPLILLFTNAFGQANSSLGGAVLDPSGAVLPGATVTALNVDTNITTKTLTNDAGVYNFPGLQPGTYKVTAEMSGFQSFTKTDVKLEVSAQARLNFEMSLASVSSEVQVTASVADQVLDSTSSTGTILQPEMVTQLPLVSNDVLDLINIMGGTVPYSSPIFNAWEQSFAGVNSYNINLQRDGITINEVRYGSGITSPSRINPEMVGEFKMILSPVDAELGRGSGQVQILTKSGANAYHGSGVWNIQNTALDANEFENNRRGTHPNWRNLNNYTLTFSGPVRKNKTFFFTSWDQQIARSRSMQYPSVLTPCARKGIFRYFNGWNNGNAVSSTTTTGTTPQRPVVDLNGVPLDARFADRVGPDRIITTGPDGVTPSSLQFTSVFGPLGESAMALIEQDPLNCSAYDPYADLGITRYYEQPVADGLPNRVLDSSGYVQRFSQIMPEANNYERGDGLNFAVHRWLRTNKGSDTVYGTGEDNQRINWTTKIDHNFNDRHKASGTFTHEVDNSTDAARLWPNGYEGTVNRRPKMLSVSVTSTIKPTLLNEARFGLSQTLTHTNNPMDNPDSGAELKDLLQELFPTTNIPHYPGYPLVVSPLGFSPESPYDSHLFGSRGSLLSTWGGTDRRWTFADTMTWTKGVHSFKFGAELRLTKSMQDAAGTQGTYSAMTIPSAWGGTTAYSAPYDISPNSVPGLVGSTTWFPMYGINANFSSGTVGQLLNLRDYMSGSLSHVRQFYYVNSPDDRSWNDISKGELKHVVDIRQREFSAFFQDNWKVSPDLTLNLGLRYEYYGVPWLDSGMTVGLAGGSSALFGVSGRDFGGFMPEKPVQLGSEYLTEQIFIGPGSPNPGTKPFNKDMNNFGPAVGFSWQLPWFGKGKTTLRGGYQLSYSAISNADPNSGFGSAIGGVSGTTYTHYYVGSQSHPYLSIANLANYIPTMQYLPDEIVPLSTIPIEFRGSGVSLNAYDTNIRSPYIQSLNLSVSRTIGSNVTVDVRYIGTLSRKQVSSMNLNMANFLNNGLLEAFNEARRGGTHPLLDKMFAGTAWTDFPSGDSRNYVPVGSAEGAPTGGDVIRARHAEALANGNYASIASALSTLNYSRSQASIDFQAPGCYFDWATFRFVNCPTTPALNWDLPAIPTSHQGAVLRHANELYPGEFPENFIVANPQLSGANLYGNYNHANYHSMQAQVTVRPIHGFSFTGTYTWSKNLGINGMTNPLDRAADYTLTGMNRTHQLNTYGNLELPLGSNGFVFRNVSSPVVKRLVEGWTLGWILGFTSGAPASLSSSVNKLYGNPVPDVVRGDLFDPKSGHVTWEPGASEGDYFGGRYVSVPDPQCSDRSLVSEEIAGDCSMMALALADDPSTIIFQQPLPGKRGNLGMMTLEGTGRITFDMNMSKRIQLTEGKSVSFRVDAMNVLNHPTPSSLSIQSNARFTMVGDPNFTISSGNRLGYIFTKAGHRTFQAKLRLDF